MIPIPHTALPAPLVEHVEPDSPAGLAGVRPGERLLALNGHRVRDAIDYHFHGAESDVELTVVGLDGEPRTLPVRKHPDEDLGLEIAETELDSILTCTNKCFFCFLKGLPRGLRKTLYVKDDDYRLSFLHGNFVTLTNLTEDDWRRLEEQRLSPLHVSVHATNPAVRLRLLGVRQAPDIMHQLRRLAAIGIRFHTQVVLCPDVNDGTELDRTINDLATLCPHLLSIAVVPVGATMYHETRMGPLNGQGMAPFDRQGARRVIAQLRRHRQQLHRDTGAPLVFPSDEFFVTAALYPPAAREYDGFPQYENGVGMLRVLLDDARLAVRRIRRGAVGSPRLTHVTLACGRLVGPTLGELATRVGALLDIRIDVVPVTNTFFGPRVNVSGLLVGGDFGDELAGRPPGDLLVLPRPSLDYYGRHFLDDSTPEQLAERLGTRIAFATTLTEVVEFVGNPPSEIISGAVRAPVTNGRSWV